MSRGFSVLLVAIALLPELLTCSLERFGGYGALAIFVGVLMFIRPRVGSCWVALAWGFLLPLSPIAGSAVIENSSLIVLLVLVCSLPRVRWLGWAAPILLYVGGAIVYETSASLAGQYSYASVVRLDEVSRARDALRGFFAVQAPSWRYFSHIVLLIGVIDLFSAVSEFGVWWRRGFLWGAGISAAYAITQWCGWFSFGLSNQNAFWSSIGRVSGLMTDPNALGVVMALALLMVVFNGATKQTSQRAVIIASLLFLGAGAVSGSRTFWIGVGVLAMGTAYVRARRLMWALLFAGLVSTAAVSLLDHYTHILSAVDQSSAVPQGLKRILSAMSLSRFEETIATRSVFLTLARAIIDRDPLFGVGANAFASYVPLVGASIPSLRGWVDNSNNFYLGIVAELGIIGFCAFLMTVLSRRIRVNDGAAYSRVSLCAVGIMLLTGPHTDFVEVLLPVAFLIGASTTERCSQGYLRSYTSMLFVLAGVIAASHRERGVYGWHDDGTVIRRWLSPEATVRVLCDEADASQTRSVVIKPSYIPTKEPLKVVVRSSELSRDILLSEPAEKSIDLPCGMYQFVVSPAWSPARAWPGASGDRRLLGVEQVVHR